MKINKGTGARANVEMEVNMFRGKCLSPTGPMKKSTPRKSISKKEKAMGNPDNNRKIKPISVHP